MSPGEKFAEFVGGLDVPILDIGIRQGHTDYIDFIKPEEVTYPIMKGIDRFSRIFIVLKGIGTCDGQEIPLFQTFFQRYSNSKGLWMGCGHYGTQFFGTIGGMREHEFSLLKDIIGGKTVSTDDLSREDSLKLQTLKICS